MAEVPTVKEQLAIRLVGDADDDPISVQVVIGYEKAAYERNGHSPQKMLLLNGRPIMFGGPTDDVPQESIDEWMEKGVERAKHELMLRTVERTVSTIFEKHAKEAAEEVASAINEMRAKGYI